MSIAHVLLLLAGCSEVVAPDAEPRRQPPLATSPTTPDPPALTDTAPTAADTASDTGLPQTGPDGTAGDTGAPESGVGAPEPEALPLCINEFMPSNQVTVHDDQGQASDWIELHNPTASDVLLDGWSVTDDPTDPAQHVLGGGLVVPAGGFLLLWADAHPELGPSHLGFALSETGEAVALYAPDGRGTVVWFGPMVNDFSVRRSTDCCYDAAASCLQLGLGGTPGATNTIAP